MKKTGRIRRLIPLLSWRYTPCSRFPSRPIHGHTPRKLPACAAISRIIADCAHSGAHIYYYKTNSLSTIFYKRSPSQIPQKQPLLPCPSPGKSPRRGVGFEVNPGQWHRRRCSHGFPGQPGGRAPAKRADRDLGFSDFPAPAWDNPVRSSHTCSALGRGRAAG